MKNLAGVHRQTTKGRIGCWKVVRRVGGNIQRIRLATFLRLYPPLSRLTKVFFNISVRLKLIEQKIEHLPDQIETKMINKLYPLMKKQIVEENNPLTKDQIKVRNKLLDKLEYKTISKDEAEILKGFLDIEKDDAEINKKWNLFFAIGVALIVLSYILSPKD